MLKELELEDAKEVSDAAPMDESEQKEEAEL